MQGQQPFRIEPKAGPAAYKTYQIVAPLRTHYRAATCAEVGCERRERGFRTTLDTSKADHARVAKWIEDHSGRKYDRAVMEPMVSYTFPAGQDCFEQHKIPLERDPIYVVRDGDYRGNPRGTRPVTRRAEDWVDDFATHQQALAERIEKG